MRKPKISIRVQPRVDPRTKREAVRYLKIRRNWKAPKRFRYLTDPPAYLPAK
jgi:hypothetical protein